MEVLAKVRSRKGGGTEVTFLTDSDIFAPRDALGEPRQWGLIVWVPMADVKRVRAALNAGEPK
jgi:hypothetical protein